MTTSSDLDTDLPVTPAPAPTCDGLRFCSITTSRGMTRGCVCVQK